MLHKYVERERVEARARSRLGLTIDPDDDLDHVDERERVARLQPALR